MASFFARLSLYFEVWTHKYLQYENQQMKELNAEGKRAEKFLEKKPGAYTVGDLTTATGLPVLESRYALEALMGKYKSRLEVTENGDLIYDFGSKLIRRGEKSFKEKWAGVQSFLWRIFVTFYKAIIAVVLVVYFIIFLIVLIALVVAASASSDGDGIGEGIGDTIGGMFRSIFYFDTHHMGRRYRPRDQWGYPYEHYEPRKTHFPHKDYKTKGNENPKVERLKEKSFIASVYDFVFGPPRVDIDPLDNHKEVATFLRESKGVVSVSELQALAGWTRPEASEFLTTCLTEFDGKAEINENGMLYGEFDDLVRTSQEKNVEVAVEYFWDEYVPEWELTGNSHARNAMIIAMNVFNLGFAGFILSGGLATLPISGIALTVALGWFPLIYSFVFFAVPVLRNFKVSKMKQLQHKENIRKRLMEAIFKKDQEQISLHELTDIANKLRKTEEKLNEKVVKQVIDDFIVEFDGTASVDDQGGVVYDFHELNGEINDIEEIRGKKLLDTNLGKRLQLGYENEDDEEV